MRLLAGFHFSVGNIISPMLLFPLVYCKQKPPSPLMNHLIPIFRSLQRLNSTFSKLKHFLSFLKTKQNHKAQQGCVEGCTNLHTLASRLLLLLGAGLLRIKSRLLLLGGPVVGAALCIFCCFGVDGLAVLCIFPGV